MAIRNIVDSSYSTDLLRILNPKENEFIVALSTNVDTKDQAVLDAAKGFHKVSGAGLERSVAAFLNNYLKTNGLFYVKSKGYFKGNLNNNSYLIIAPREIAEELVSHHDDWFGQDSVIAFGPDCSAELFSIPEDYCTKVENLWLRFAFDGEVIEEAEKKSTPSKEDIALNEAADETLEAEEEEKISIGGRSVRKRGTSKNEQPRGTINPNPKWTEERIVSETYDVAPRVYNKYRWKNLRYTLDDFMQDAAVYILSLYRKRYFPLDSDNIQPMLYRLIDGYFVINKRKELVKIASKEELSLNREMSYGDEGGLEQKTELDLVKDNKNLNPEEFERVSRGKEILEGILDDFDVVPYASKKYTYEILNGDHKSKKVSEALLARLLVSGESLHSILRLMGMSVTNSGADSRSAFIAHKLPKIIDKIATKINSLPDEENKIVKDYLGGQVNE